MRNWHAMHESAIYQAFDYKNRTTNMCCLYWVRKVAKAFLLSVTNNNLWQSVEALLFKEREGSMTFAERIFIIFCISDNRASRLRDKQRTKEFHLWIITTPLCLSLAESQGSCAWQAAVMWSGKKKRWICYEDLVLAGRLFCSGLTLNGFRQGKLTTKISLSLWSPQDFIVRGK